MYLPGFPGGYSEDILSFSFPSTKIWLKPNIFYPINPSAKADGNEYAYKRLDESVYSLPLALANGLKSNVIYWL
jgi:hypothetical protein